MEPAIERLEKLCDELNLIGKLKQRVKSDNDFELHTVTIPEQTIYRRRRRADTVEERKEHLRDIIPDAMRKYGSDTSKRMYFIEYPLEDPNLISTVSQSHCRVRANTFTDRRKKKHSAFLRQL